MPILLLLLLADPKVSPLVHAETKALAEQATASYGAEKFAAALARFQEAYANEPLPSLLFNIAQCHRSLGHWHLAFYYYQRYLEAVPRAANLAKARALLAEAKEKAASEPAPPPSLMPPSFRTPLPAEEAAAPPVAPRSQPAPLASTTPNSALVDVFEPELVPPPPDTGPPAGALALVIGGGAVLAAGIVLGAINLSINGQNHHVNDTDTITLSQAQLEDTAGTVAVPANLVGGAAVASGLAWWLLAR